MVFLFCWDPSHSVFYGEIDSCFDGKCTRILKTINATGTRTTTIDLEWKVLYVGSAHDSHQDQVLDEILVGPVPVGMNKFVLQADAPLVDKLPDDDDLLGVTVVLVTCSYKEREFVRVGYYVNNEYMGEYNSEIGPPKGKHLDLGLVQREILADKPRVTKFPISWGNEVQNQAPPQEPVMESKLETTAGTPLTDLDTDMDFE